MDSRNRAPADEIRHFTHEDIEGPEGHGEDDLENCDMLSEGSDTADPREHTLPPYPGHTSIAGSSGASGSFGGNNRASFAPDANKLSSPLGQPPAHMPPDTMSMRSGPSQEVSSLRNAGYGGVGTVPPVSNTLHSPPPLPHAAVADVKPFPSRGEGWGQAGHRHYGQRDMSMMYPQRRPRPENLDLPNANIPPPMIGGPAYHHQFPPGDPRAMANGYSVGHPNAHMPRHSHQMMYGPGRPPMPMVMPPNRMMMGHPPPMPEQPYRKQPHIKKPLNAFMLFMKEHRAEVVAECTLKESAAINQILGKKWHNLSRAEQGKYYDMARIERQQHQRLYPNYNPRDAYSGLGPRRGRRPRRGDRLENEEVAQLKKCRARYGLENQDKWCKPCRRKKKCTKFTNADDMGSDEEGGDGKRDRESRDPNSKDGSDLEDDDKSIASANSSDEGDEDDEDDLLPHFNDEDSPMHDSLISPTLTSSGGIAVLANMDASSLGGGGGGAPPCLSSYFPHVPPVDSGNAAGVPLCASGELNLGAIPAADMILAPTPAEGEKDVSCALPLSSLPVSVSLTAGEYATASLLGASAEVVNDISLTPLTTPENNQQEGSEDSGSKESGCGVTAAAGQTSNGGAPAAVLSGLNPTRTAVV